METVNQGVLGIVVSLALAGCVATQPVTGNATDPTEQTAARFVTNGEQLCWQDVAVGPVLFVALEELPV